MNDTLILLLVLATATSVSFRYVGWLGKARLSTTVIPEYIVNRLTTRHRVMWVIGLIVQLQAIAFYIECDTTLWICTLVVFAVVFGQIHDIEFSVEIWRSFHDEVMETYTIPTIPLLTITSSVALWIHSESTKCYEWGAGLFSVSLFGGLVLTTLYAGNLSVSPAPKGLPDIENNAP